MRQLNNDPEYIIFSSHKTGTQTLVNTLTQAGYGSIHLHLLRNLDATVSTFREYLRSYINKHGRRAKIITSFRLPIERHISSFFQWYGTGAMTRIPEFTSEDTVINQIEIRGLNTLFVSDVGSTKLVGYEDSLHQLCEVLEIDLATLQLDQYRCSFNFDHELAEIYLFNFSDLFEGPLNNICSKLGVKINVMKNNNISSEKWYASKYKDFKEKVFIPRSVIQGTYQYRRDIIEIFYPGQFNDLMEKDCHIYSDLREKP